MNDQDVLRHITALVDAEQGLYGQEHISDDDRVRLQALEVELDQYEDLLRQRRALRGAGKDPGQAHLRGAGTVEHYEQ
ncbi:MAG: DUF2630 family protein [Herpetosiphonaceae bacterium]|nr:DUF2630 family protein [Herpetosiphonaceae bacterium]